MLIKNIERLAKIKQKSKLAEFGCCFDGKDFFFFNVGVYEWVCYMDFERDEHTLKKGSLYLDMDSLRQITEIFVEGDVVIYRKDNFLYMEQGHQKFVMTIKEESLDMVSLPNTSEGKPYLKMGRVSSAIYGLTKIPLKGTVNLETLLHLTKDLVSRQSSSFIGLTRKVEWDYFPEEPSLFIESEVVRYLEGATLFYNGNCFKLEADRVSVVLPKSDPLNFFDCDAAFQHFKDETFLEHIQFPVKSIVGVTDLVSKLFSDKPTLSGLTFTSTETGLNVHCGDSVALFSHFIECDHQLLPDFVFALHTKLLSNLKYCDSEVMYARFCFRNDRPIQVVFFSDLDKSYSLSDEVFLFAVQNMS